MVELLVAMAQSVSGCTDFLSGAVERGRHIPDFVPYRGNSTGEQRAWLKFAEPRV
jgi:hypothetical protein